MKITKYNGKLYKWKASIALDITSGYGRTKKVACDRLLSNLNKKYERTREVILNSRRQAIMPTSKRRGFPEKFRLLSREEMKKLISMLGKG